MQQNDISRNKTSPEERKFFAFLPQRMFAFLVVALLLFPVLSVTPAHSETKDNEGPKAAASGNPSMNNCANAGANLSGNFAVNPCDLTAINNTFDFDNYVGGQQKIYYGGQQVRDHLEDWWVKNFLPDLKSMAKQLTASLIEQTRQFGTMIDSQNITRTGGSLEKSKLDLSRNNDPSEQACVSGSAVTAISKANSGSNALATGLTKDITKLSSNVAPTPTSDATAPSTSTTSPPTISPAEDQKKRWDEYCAEFFDPYTNNGVSTCPDIDPEDRYQTIPDGDIMAEGFLLNDTIDMGEEHHSKAANALLRNLVYPKIREKIPDSAVNTATGREAILAQQHLDSARNIAVNVIASIIARRAAIPSTSPETKPDEDAVANKVAEVPGGGGGGENGAYKYAYSKINPPVAGGPQFGEYYNPDSGNTLCQTLTKQALGGYITPVTEAAGLPPDHGGAIAAWATFVKIGAGHTDFPPPKGTAVYFNAPSQQYGHTGISAGDGKYIGVWKNGFVGISDINKDVTRWNKGGKKYDLGPEAKYLGYVIPLDNGVDMPLMPPQSAGVNISDIRIKAGIDPDDTSPDPSYNEIMLAMTKERFLDPEYFIKMQGNTGAIKQEQTAINAYTTMVYQDIYRLQEQINALLAARASLKFDTATKSSQVQSAPVTKPSH